MKRNLRIWIQCPEIRPMLLQYWLLFVAQVLTLVILSPLLLLVVILAYLAEVLGWIAERLHWPYDTVIDFLETKRSNTIKHAHSIISVEEIQKRIKDEKVVDLPELRAYNCKGSNEQSA